VEGIHYYTNLESVMRLTVAHIDGCHCYQLRKKYRIIQYSCRNVDSIYIPTYWGSLVRIST